MKGKCLKLQPFNFFIRTVYLIKSLSRFATATQLMFVLHCIMKREYYGAQFFIYLSCTSLTQFGLYHKYCNSDIQCVPDCFKWQIKAQGLTPKRNVCIFSSKSHMLCRLLTIFPNVMSPTNALGGIRLSDICRDS